jgi:AsmA protein
MSDTIERAVNDKKLEALGELAPAAGDETRFTRLGGSVQITNGVARNDDLALESPGLVRVTGQGTADLVRERLDYRVSLGSVPLLVQGPFTALKYRPDTSALAKKAVDKQLDRLKDKLRRR